MEIQHAAVIITGGASGMGAATARLLSHYGAKVTILDTKTQLAEKIADEINGLSFFCDVTQPESVEHALQQSREKHGPARICINCAGLVYAKKIIGKQGAHSLDQFRRIIEVNLIGTFNVMRLVALEMSTLTPVDTGERGVIINTTSIAAFEGQIGQCAYSASKGGIVALTLPAARELAEQSIRVMGIAPGLVDTPMFSQLNKAAKEALTVTVPFPKRLGKPEEYANLVQHIIQNPMLNGTIIRLDGALRLQSK